MKRPWMPFYVGDFVAKTMHLGPTERGIYISLIIYAWQNDGKIPLDNRRLAIISGCDSRLWHQYREAVLQFFDVVDASTAQHRRVCTELQRCKEISSKRKDAAMQMHSSRSTNAVHFHTHSQSQRKNGNGDLKKKEDNRESKREGFKAYSDSKQFAAWKAFAFSGDVPLWRELVKREQEGRQFDFPTQWPPGHKEPTA